MANVSKRIWTYKGETKSAWTVRYKDNGGVHRQRTFDRKKPADDYKRQVENEMEAGTHIVRCNTRTVGELIAEFTADVERRVRDGQCGRGYLDRCVTSFAYLLPTLGAVVVRDMTWQQVEGFCHGLRTAPTCRGRAMSRRSIRNHMGMFGTMMNYAVRRGYAPRNVVPDAMREVGPLNCERIHPFTRDEVRAVFAAAEVRRRAGHPRNVAIVRAMIYLAGVCGLRKGEIMALTWDQIDFDRGEVHVVQALNDYDELKPPKTAAGVRVVPMPEVVARTLARLAPFVVPEKRGLIFRTRYGAKLGDVGFYKMWHPILERAGMAADAGGRWRRFHSLRHFAGSAMLEGGVPLAEVSRLLGHAHTGVTAEIYSHAIVSSTHRADDIARCAALIAPPPVAQGLRIAA